MKFKDDNQRAHDQNHIRLTENQGLEIVHITIKQEILISPGRDTYAGSTQAYSL